VDLSTLRHENALAILKDAIVLRSLQSARPLSPADTLNARSMLQLGLWPVLQIERRPRLCFVLRMLLGYGISSCAQMLAIEEQVVKTLLQNALIQLQRATTPTTQAEAPPRLGATDMTQVGCCVLGSQPGPLSRN
jgi:hypothetical protein